MYETFEHTADLGLRVRANSLNQLFAEAGEALFSVMVTHPESIGGGEEMPLVVPGHDMEELLHDWLAELLFTFHVRRRVLSRFKVYITPDGLTATALSEVIDPKRHEIDMEVKAITWHGLKIVSTPDGWMAEIIVDI